MEEIDIRVAVSISLPALQAWRHSFGELKLSAEAHSFGELKLPSSQTMLISHCRRKQRSPRVAPLAQEGELFGSFFCSRFWRTRHAVSLQGGRHVDRMRNLS